jgi:hypothetical protein
MARLVGEAAKMKKNKQLHIANCKLQIAKWKRGRWRASLQVAFGNWQFAMCNCLFSSPRLTGLTVLILSLVVLSGGAAQPDLSLLKADRQVSKKAEKAAPLIPDFTELPPDAIIAICEQGAESLRPIPRAYILTAGKMRLIQEELDQLRRQVARPVALTPTKLLLKGKADGNLITLQAQFEFETSKPGDVVRLGCAQAHATGVSLDGKTPRLMAGRPGSGVAAGSAHDDEGFSVQVSKPGEHQLNLDLVLALSPRPAGQGFVLDLPRAAITKIELELPTGSRDVRIGGKALGGSDLALKGTVLTGNLGAIDRLELDWKSAQAASAGAVLAAEGKVQVRLNARELSSEARLTLRVLAGQAQQWRLIVPRGAVLAIAADDKARIKPEIGTQDQGPVSIRTINLKEASAEPLLVTVSTRQPAPRLGGKPVAVGPFNVLGAVRQSGSVLVSSSVADWHLEATPHGDLTRRASSEEELLRDRDLVAAFRYGPDGERRAGLSWLDLEVESVRGSLKTRLEHVLYLAPGEDRNGAEMRWHVRTTLTVTPRWAGIERFRVQMPAGCEFDDHTTLPERIRTANPDRTTGLVDFPLNPGGSDPLAPIKLTVEGTYTAVPGAAPGRASLGLPRPLGMIENAGTVRVQVPGNMELVAPKPGQSGGLILERQDTHDFLWRYPRRAPERVEVAWRDYRPTVQVNSRVELTLGRGQGLVRQELRYQLPAGTDGPTTLTLKVPEAVAGSLRVSKGGQLAGGVVDGLARVTASEPGQPVLDLTYAFDLPEPGAFLDVPLVVADNRSRGETRVLVWSESGLLPLPPRDGWNLQNIEQVPGRDRLPVLVLRSTRADSPLRLRLRPDEPGFTVLIERALVRVEVAADLTQTYRVSYRLGRLAGENLDFELPAPVATINLVARLDGKRVNHELLADPDRPGESGRARGTLVRLRLSPELVRRPGASSAPATVLELSYQLPPERMGRSPLTTTLVPPVPLGQAGGVPARWQINTPSGWVVLWPEMGPGPEVTWGWRGWLVAPRARSSAAELEAWFSGRESPGTDSAQGTPALVLYRDGAEPVTLAHVPQKAWLVVCSLALVVLGLVLARLLLSAHPGLVVLGLVLALVVLALAVLAGLLLAVCAPGLAGQVAYGCQPGLLVVVLIVALQWVLHERYRRQIVFLPSFSRPRSGSSVAPAADAPPATEPSTVDAPPRNQGSSVERGP